MRIPDCLTAACFLLGGTLGWAAEVAPPLPAARIAAAERGEADAQYQVARAYLRGEGVPKDVNKAFALMKAAAEHGNADAIGGLGYFYSVGVAVPKDAKLALEWFRKGAEKGSAKARLNLGKYLLEGKGGEQGVEPEKLREEGLEWIKKAANQNLPQAALSYGEILYFGDHGVEKDDAGAARYFQIAAVAGLANAQNFLGVMSETGMGCSLDKAVAEHWFRKAALQGHVKAQGNLGRILWQEHSGSRQVRIESLAWLLMASDGDIVARKLLEEYSLRLKEGEMEAAKTKVLELRTQIHQSGLLGL